MSHLPKESHTGKQDECLQVDHDQQKDHCGLQYVYIQRANACKTFLLFGPTRVWIFKVYRVALGKIKSCIDWLFLCLNKLNKQTLLRDTTTWYCLTLFICGGPCHLPSFKQCPGGLREQLVYSVMLSSFDHLINILNLKILSLNFFSKTTWCPFNQHQIIQ